MTMLPRREIVEAFLVGAFVGSLVTWIVGTVGMMLS